MYGKGILKKMRLAFANQIINLTVPFVKPLIIDLPAESSRAESLRPLTPPYVPFGIRRFNSISKYAV